MDLYHIYSAIKHKYVGIIVERNFLAVDCQSRLDHILLSLDQPKVLKISS
jgi:hypothetical protein